jgi:hypothetical protein
MANSPHPFYSLPSSLNKLRLKSAGWNAQRTFAAAIRWERAQMNTSAMNYSGSWI